MLGCIVLAEENMFAVQRDLRRFVVMDDKGAVLPTVDAGARHYRLARVGKYLYAIAADAESDESNEYFLRIDIGGTEQEKVLGRFAFDAHGLVYEVEKFWCNDRAGKPIVAFAPAVEAR